MHVHVGKCGHVSVCVVCMLCVCVYECVCGWALVCSCEQGLFAEERRSPSWPRWPRSQSLRQSHKVSEQVGDSEICTLK